MLKEKMINFLESYWTNGRDDEVVRDFIEDFFNQYQPERSKREDTSLTTIQPLPRKTEKWLVDRWCEEMGVMRCSEHDRDIVRDK